MVLSVSFLSDDDVKRDLKKIGSQRKSATQLQRQRKQLQLQLVLQLRRVPLFSAPRGC